MRRELLDELVTAAQEVVNDAEPQGDGLVRYGKDGLGPPEALVEVGQAQIDRLKAVVKAISDETVAFVVSYAQETRGEPVNWAQIEAAVGHSFTEAEREAIAPTPAPRPACPRCHRRKETCECVAS